METQFEQPIRMFLESRPSIIDHEQEQGESFKNTFLRTVLV